MITVPNWPLVGRGEEMAIIAGILGGDDEYAGVVIAGRAGVGKTRLSREAVAVAARDGWTVRSTAGTAAAQAIPLGGFIQWMDRHSTDQEAGLVAAVIDALTASPDGAPVLVVVDDAHLLDELSAFVLYELIRRRLAVVIATIRTGQSAPRTLTALWKDGQLRRLDLQPLSRPQSDALLEAALDGRVGAETAERLWDLTRGNTLFLREMIRQEVDSGRLTNGAGGWRWERGLSASPTLTDLIDLYIYEASEPVLEVLDLVALAEPLDLIYLDALVDREVIEEAERREVIVVSETSAGRAVKPVHPLYGEVRRAHIGPVRAARLRGRIAAAMSELSPRVGAPDPARLGLLWLESDLAGNAEVFTNGAIAAFMRLDLTLTHRLSQAAVAAGAGVEARLLLAQSATRLGRGDEAEQALEPLGAQPPEFVWVSMMLARASTRLFTRGAPEESWAVIDDALRATPADPEPSLLAFRVVQLAFAARPREAVTTAESIDRNRLSPLSAIILTCGLTVAHGDLGSPEASSQAAAEGNRLARQSPVAAYQAIGLNMLHADALALAGCIGEVRALGDRIKQQWAGTLGVAHTVASMISGLGALAGGDIPLALTDLHAAIVEAEEAESRTGGSGVSYLLWVAYTEALARAGDCEAATEAQERMRSGRHPAYIFAESAFQHAAAWVAAARAHLSEAVELVSQAAQFAREHGQLTREVRCLQSALQFGAKPDVDRVGELAAMVCDPRAAVVARWACALADRDGEGLLEVSAQLETMGDRIAAADAAAQAAGAFDRANRRGSKLTAAGRATRIISECGAGTPATRAVVAPLPLSSREREIATLVSEGLSNKKIADVLTMSVRTVEGHIYRACNKLGTANRAELGRLVSEFAGPSHT